MTDAGAQFFHISATCAARGRLEEAERYYLAGNLNEALAAAQQAWREHPQEPEVFRTLAYLHLARGEFAPAEQAAQQALKIDGDSPTSAASLVQVYLAFNWLKPAERTLAAARAQFPEELALMALEADLRFRLRQDREASELAIAVLRKNSRDGYVNALLGGYYARTRNYATAVQMFRVAVEVYPQRWDYLRDFGVVLLRTGEPAEARAVLAQAFRLNQADDTLNQQVYLAHQLSTGPHQAYWTTALFFYDHPALGWLLHLLGWSAMLVGMVSEYGASIVGHPSLWSLELCVGGIACLVLTQAGLALRKRRGARFEALLSQWVEQEDNAVLSGKEG